MAALVSYLRSGAIGDLAAIPVHADASVPPGTAVLDVDPDEPRHITRIRVHDPAAFELSNPQNDQIRDHYQAMNERAGRLLDWWSEVTDRHMPRGWRP